MLLILCFFFKQKTAYEMRISDWSSDVCSSDLSLVFGGLRKLQAEHSLGSGSCLSLAFLSPFLAVQSGVGRMSVGRPNLIMLSLWSSTRPSGKPLFARITRPAIRSEAHTSELQSLMRTSYAVICLKKKHQTTTQRKYIQR